MHSASAQIGKVSKIVNIYILIMFVIGADNNSGSGRACTTRAAQARTNRHRHDSGNTPERIGAARARTRAAEHERMDTTTTTTMMTRMTETEMETTTKTTATTRMRRMRTTMTRMSR